MIEFVDERVQWSLMQLSELDAMEWAFVLGRVEALSWTVPALPI
jgi:hypothetical protein